MIDELFTHLQEQHGYVEHKGIYTADPSFNNIASYQQGILKITFKDFGMPVEQFTMREQGPSILTRWQARPADMTQELYAQSPLDHHLIRSMANHAFYRARNDEIDLKLRFEGPFAQEYLDVLLQQRAEARRFNELRQEFFD